MTYQSFTSFFGMKSRLFLLSVAVLFMVAVLNAESMAMDVVDSALLKQFDRAGNKPVSVIITCRSKCRGVIKALENAGIRITSTQSMVLGSIAAEITKDQLSFLQTVTGISAIEYDHEVSAFE